MINCRVTAKENSGSKNAIYITEFDIKVQHLNKLIEFRVFLITALQTAYACMIESMKRC